MKDTNLRIPGPVPLPQETLDLMSSQMINHRGQEYADMLDQMTNNLKTVLMTKSDVYFITASGTGGMESAIVNTTSPGDKVLSISIGWFGERFAEISDAYGCETIKISFEYGDYADPEKIKPILSENPDIKAVLITHNESSTGVRNPLKEICEIIKNNSEALILVDAVSSAAGSIISTDAWGIDVVATASQKSWIAPPGISMVSFSDKAWKAYDKSKCPKYYYDMNQYREYLEIGQPPFTPSLTTMYTLHDSLHKMVSEGMETIFDRHSRIAQFTRDLAKNIGLDILPIEAYASDTVTAIKLPENVDGKIVVKEVEKNYNIVLGGGQQKLAGKIIRIGHMGWINQEDIEASIIALKETLDRL
ncbi:MAG: alanine--glyoxylate aminotransferase family protein [SAR202 cluster bacterium]|nr:alanine--glyoxylate aminotransferase family protein [SAR202 cluster bacterium]|tara:strand:+ start:3227 stop:4312 length:1086 start_codon:yes stop_codon:yes gene_type:complete